MRVPLVAAAAAAAVVLGPALGAREILARDLVALDAPVLTPRLLGLGHEPPRGVPSDALVAVLGQALPPGVVVAWVCLACLVAAGAGVARIALDLSGARVGATVAAVVAVWNPWVVERLAIGQWPLLLGYAALPWLVRRLTSARCGPGTVGLVVLGSLGGAVSWTLVALGCLGAGGALLVARRRAPRRRTAEVVLALLGSAVPWAVPALLRPGGTGSDPAGFSVFAPRPDLPAGTWVSVLTGGGIWNGEVVPPGRDSLPGAIGALALLALGVAGLALVMRRAVGDRAEGTAQTGAPPLAMVLAGAAGLLVVLVAGWEPAGAVLAALPGGGLLRDSTRMTAPWVLALAVGAGALAARVAAGGWRWPAAALALLPVAALPGAALGAGGALAPTRSPESVHTIAAAVDADPAPGAVAVLPWAAYRRYDWNGERPSVQPWSRLVHRRVVASGDLPVLTSRGEVTVAGEDPLADRVHAALASDDPAGALTRTGVGLVLVDAPASAPALEDQARATLVIEQGGLRLYRLSGPVTVAAVGAADPPASVVLGLDLAASLLLAGLAVTARRSAGRTPHRPTVG